LTDPLCPGAPGSQCTPGTPQWSCNGVVLDRKPVSMLMTDTATFDAVHDLMDDMQRMNQKVDALCRLQGIDPAEAGRLPGEAAEAVKAA
jgi:hypothetical protein